MDGLTLQEDDLSADGLSVAFKEAGFAVEAPGAIKGASGVKHRVDLLCRGNRGTILVDLRKDDESAGVLPVISLYSKARDTKCSAAILITVSEACPLAQHLSERYGLLLCETRTTAQALSFIKREVLEKQPKGVEPVYHGAAPSIDTRGAKSHRLGAELRYGERTKVKAIKSALELLILQASLQKPLTGYDMISAVHSKFGILLSPGTVYPVLQRLEEEDIIKSSETAHKRIYSPTPFGKLVSNVSLAEWNGVVKKLLWQFENFEGASLELETRALNPVPEKSA